MASATWRDQRSKLAFSLRYWAFSVKRDGVSLWWFSQNNNASFAIFIPPHWLVLQNCLCQILLVIWERNASMFITSTIGKLMERSTLKCLSSVTIYRALVTMAQSTNLLSSLSAWMRLKWKWVLALMTLFLLIIVVTMVSANHGLILRAMTSWYSSIISLVMHKA